MTLLPYGPLKDADFLMTQPMDIQNSLSRVVQEAGVIDQIGTLVDTLGCQRLLLVCGGSTRRGALYARAVASLGSRVVLVMDQVVAHSSTGLVTQVAEKAKLAQIDGIVAIGGGSSSDTAKGVAILLAEGGKIEQHASRFTPPDQFVPQVLHQPKIPIIAVPTTLSAAEVTPGLGLRDESGRKLLFWDVKLACRLILLDPDATREVPVSIMAETGMNGFAHCVEGLYSRLRNPVAESLALQGIKMFQKWLPQMVKDPQSITARAGALTAANLSGMVISTARVGIHHAICHCLGAKGGLSHGVANSIMLPHALTYNQEDAAPALLLLAQAMDCTVNGDERQTILAAIQAVRDLQIETGVPLRLRDTSLKCDILPAIAHDVMHDRGLFFNPRKTESSQAVLEILEKAW